MYSKPALFFDDEVAALKDLALEYLTLAEIAYNKIKGSLLRHEVAPGVNLSCDELMLRLKLSQAPMREALARLAQEGYLTQVINRGYRVSEMSVDEVVELFDLRQVLEAHCVEDAIRNISSERIESLEFSVKSSRKSIVTNRPLLDRCLINKDFHLIVAEIAGNNAVCRILQDTCEKLVIRRPIEGDAHGGFAVLRHHRDILRAIKCQEVNKAQELMRAHLDEIKYTLLKQIAVRNRTAQFN
jgi:DNA-binding GntR family transcriptional regulator